MKGLILFLIAVLLFLPLTLLNIILVVWEYGNLKSIDGYFYQTAVDINRFGNRNFRTLFNATLIKEEGYQFGDSRETISGVLGKNQRDKTLSKTGKLLASILDWIDENHCEKSIVEF